MVYAATKGRKGKQGIKSSGLQEVRQDELVFGGDAVFLQKALGSIPHGTIALVNGKAGCGKSTLALESSADQASKSKKILYISTEMSEDRLRARLKQIIGHRKKREQKLIEKSIHIVDDLGDVSYLPDFLLRRISAETHTGKPYDLVVMDSVNAGVPSAASKIYKRIFDSFALLRSAGITFIGLTTSNKSGKMSGPNSLAHESCANLTLTSAGSHRYITTSKNRNGIALGEPICLEMTPCGRLISSPHQGSMAASVGSFLPGDTPEVELQTAISLPPFGETGRVLCPNLPRLQVSQLLSSIERSPDLDVTLESFVVNIQLVGESIFRKTLHLPLALGVVASFYQKPIPKNHIWLGELDLNLGLRPLPETVRLSLETAIESDALPSGTTVVVPASDARSLSSGGRGVKVVGVDDLHEAMKLIEPKKRGRPRSKVSARTTAKRSVSKRMSKGGRGSPASTSRVKRRSKGARTSAVTT